MPYDARETEKIRKNKNLVFEPRWGAEGAPLGSGGQGAARVVGSGPKGRPNSRIAPSKLKSSKEITVE